MERGGLEQAWSSRAAARVDDARGWKVPSGVSYGDVRCKSHGIEPSRKSNGPALLSTKDAEPPTSPSEL